MPDFSIVTENEFKYPVEDAYAEEHRLIEAWLIEIGDSEGTFLGVDDQVFKNLEIGKQINNKKGNAARRLIHAFTIQQLFYEDRQDVLRAVRAEEISAGKKPDERALNFITNRKKRIAFSLFTLLRRKQELQEAELELLMVWIARAIEPRNNPELFICRNIEHFLKGNRPSERFKAKVEDFAKLRERNLDQKIQVSAKSILQLSAFDVRDQEQIDSDDMAVPSPEPAFAGVSGIFHAVKTYLGMSPKEDEAEEEIIGLDQFPLNSNSPLKQQHEYINSFIEQVLSQDYRSGQLHFVSSPLEVIALTERFVHILCSTEDFSNELVWRARNRVSETLDRICCKQIAWDRELFFDLLIYETFRKLWLEWRYNLNLASICETVEEFQKQAPLSQGERFVLCLLRTAVTSDPPLGMLTEDQQKLTRMIQDKKYFFLAPSEIWSETVNQDLQEMQENERKQWENLLSHCLKPNGSKPSKGWLTQSTTMVKEIGSDRIKEKFRKWIPLVSAGKAAYRVGNYMSKDEGTLCAIDSRNGSFLKGMMWLIQCLEEPTDLIHLIRDLAMTSYRKLPGVGHRGGFVGNAAVYALSTIGTIEAVGQLAMLKLRVKSRATQKEIEKAFNKSAEALGLSREDIEELGVPTYGLEEVGRLEERLGDYTAQIEVDGSDATLAFSDANGKQLKSVPAKVKSDHQEELKELRQALKDIKGMLPAQRDRIDSMFLAQKSWPVQIWRERYLEHPLVGTIARRLLWNVDDTPVLFIDGEPHDVTGKKINHGKTAEITLWHPINYSVEEIVAWRDRLEELQITQPFKQAFREVYPLTAAEENTRTYSNRFAAHIIRQHQFNALCAARRWQNKLRLMVDDNYAPAEKELPDWGLRAEFWIEGIGDNYGVDTSESGAFLRLVTDQVRFYRTGAAKNLGHASGGGYAMNASGAGENEINEPLPLEEIPALVFSEIMRDVDLFVGVASVGNDPTWQDGGPEGRYRDYWYKYAFGTLQESAKTRRVVLERLIPRLKIASRCHLDERFLYVEGTRHTYKIHLGSGNILISTNDSYLCIVPDARTRLNQDSLYLPFEGDSTLSIILSKAFLLAADDKIKDPTILRQL